MQDREESRERADAPAPLSIRSGGPPPDAVVSEDQARAIWQRAAQLQADASQRREETAHEPDASAAAQDAAEAGLRIADVEAAAVEAGIAPEFVRLALAETEHGTFDPRPIPPWLDRTVTKLLGTDRRSFEVRRRIEAPPADVLAAVQRIFPAHPYLLTLKDSIGGHPLSGGTLLFQAPSYGTTDQTPFALAMAYGDIKRLHVALRPVRQGARTECEVVIAADLRPGRRLSLWVGSASVGAGTVGGGAAVGAAGAGLAGAMGAVGIAGFAVMALPALAGAAALGRLVAAGYGALYRWGVRQGINGIEDLLRTLDAGARINDFAFPPPPPVIVPDGGTVVS